MAWVSDRGVKGFRRDRAALAQPICVLARADILWIGYPRPLSGRIPRAVHAEFRNLSMFIIGLTRARDFEQSDRAKTRFHGQSRHRPRYANANESLGS
jgi:hypothetical protein